MPREGRHHGKRASEGELTPREMEVLACLSRRRTNTEIAVELWIEVSTVKNHVHSIFEKLNAKNRREVVDVAIFRKLIPDDQVV